ncbi:aKG-HExxH-type peptide beta-hydroxylase [Hyphomonas sp.]|uniref:aKG-HExxH-type peptide beta-hydroxylase n=1 Tax=Hyphomonas sp. TaxID=87 RepID=UPI003002A0AB
MLHFQFIPNSGDADATNQAMHDGLYDSLRYLAEELSNEAPRLASDFEAWHQNIGPAQRLSSAVFGMYYDVVEALQAGDTETGVALIQRILMVQPVMRGTKITVLGRDYAEPDSRRIETFMGAPETGAAGVTQPDQAQADRFATKLREAITWIEHHLPELHDEMNALLGELILVGPAEGSLEFEGGTCFRLWGAVALNAERKASVADLIVTLAHEEGHAALFGACKNEMLVENPDSELFWSPIRRTKRPLEGIFHASFVSARMIWVLRHMLASKEFGWLERRRLRTILREAEAIQRDSADIVRREGRLTETGKAVLQAMTRFMDAPGKIPITV